MSPSTSELGCCKDPFLLAEAPKIGQECGQT